MAAALELVDRVLDAGSYLSWDSEIDISGHPEDYQESLRKAQERTGVDESILTGSGQLHGRPVATIVNEFGFLGGSIGRAAAGRIVDAIERATADRLPLLAVTASGGTRMQEGTPAFVEMSRIAEALARHKATGLPYLVYLRNPTTGGVFASWGALGHMTAAEPGALVGFLGPKVYETLHGQPFPEGVQLAERLVDAGVIDVVVDVQDLRDIAVRALSILLDPPTASTRKRRRTTADSGPDIWTNVEATRAPDRAGLGEFLRYGSDSTVLLSGTGAGERNRVVLVALARIDGVPCVVVGQDRAAEQTEPLGPAGLRQAQRGMALAEQLGLPLLTVIDTAGADLSEAAEVGGLAREIGRCLEQLTSLRTPTVSLLLGQGCGGGALALQPAKRRVAASKAWMSPLPPEGASAIVFGDTEHAPELAERQHIGAADLLADGIVQSVVAEHDDDTAESLCAALAAEVGAHLRPSGS